MWFRHIAETVAAQKRGYAVVVGAVLVAFSVRLLLNPILGASQPYSIFYPVILGAAYLHGRGPAIVAAGLSGCLAFWIFVDPNGSTSPAASAVTALCFFCGTSGTAIYLITGLKAALRRLSDEQGKLQNLAETHAGLFKDLQGRVGHHMSLLVGILSFQAKGEPDPETLALLRKAGERSQLIAETLNALSAPATAYVDFAEFSRFLARRMCFEAHEATDKVEVLDGSLTLPVEVATTLGVALAECLAWVLQRKPAGILRVRFRSGPEGVTVLVSHNGETGSELVALAPTAYMFRAMVEQLGAKVSFEPDDVDGPGLGIFLPLAPEGVRAAHFRLRTLH